MSWMTFVSVPGVFSCYVSLRCICSTNFFSVGIRMAYIRPLIDEDVANISF